MRKCYSVLIVLAVGFGLILGGAPIVCPQESATEEFTLEEITVTAEKREVNIQDIPASVQAIPGADLVEQGKRSVAEILENVPNLVYAPNDQLGRGDPRNNIAIRGIKRTQDGGGPGPIPSTTSTYVDGVFEGTGGEYDLNRVEVLRGPQGTLYGRSATSGVVAFYTNNPKLGNLEGNISAEYGSGNTINTQAAINVPAGDKMALRISAHYLNQEKDYRLDDKAGGKETREGRIKALFQPTEKFSALLTLSASDKEARTGAWDNTLTEPDKVHFKTEKPPCGVGDAIPEKFRQASLDLNYDLGGSALTYIGAIHTHDYTGTGGPSLSRGMYAYNIVEGDPDKTQTHEIRWTSDTEGPLSWLIGGNYYHYKYDWIMSMMQKDVWPLNPTDPRDTTDVMAFRQYVKGSTRDYGIFTEETFKLRDDLRITAGLRYDKTEVAPYMGYDMNLNGGMGGVFNPEIKQHYPGIGGSLTDFTKIVRNFKNYTYKLRLEYNLAPDNMLYALTSTGFLPGSAYFVTFQWTDQTGAHVDFKPYIFPQQKLTSYEIGSKNRFLDNRLQVNAAVFYQNYGGYQESVGQILFALRAMSFIHLILPVKIYGAETDVSWLLTQYDKVTFSAGYQKTKVTDYPVIEDPNNPGTMVSAKKYAVINGIAGIPKLTANLTYDHTFLFGNGSSLVPRAELRYKAAHYLKQTTEVEVSTQNSLPYYHQDSVVLLNLGATWSSPKSTYSVTGYVRNATDELYKTNVLLPMPGPSSGDPSVTVGDPRTYGIQVSVNF